MNSTAEDAEDARDSASTLEQQYIRLLLLEVLNNGQFSPRDALWADGWFCRWAKALRLEWRESANGARATKKGFVVDLDGTDGLRRAANAAPRNPLYLDPTPLAALFDKELESLRGTERAVRIHDAGDARRQDRAAEQAQGHLRPRARPGHAPRRARAGCARDPADHRTSEHHPDPARERRGRTRASRRRRNRTLDANTFSPLGATTDFPAPAAGDAPRPRPVARRERCRSGAGNLAGEGSQRFRFPSSRADRRPQPHHSGLADRHSRKRGRALDDIGGAAVPAADGQLRRDRRGAHRPRAERRQDGREAFRRRCRQPARSRRKRQIRGALSAAERAPTRHADQDPASARAQIRRRRQGDAAVVEIDVTRCG